MEDEKPGGVGKGIAYNFKLRMTEKSSQMDGWMGKRHIIHKNGNS